LGILLTIDMNVVYKAVDLGFENIGISLSDSVVIILSKRTLHCAGRLITEITRQFCVREWTGWRIEHSWTFFKTENHWPSITPFNMHIYVVIICIAYPYCWYLWSWKNIW